MIRRAAGTGRHLHLQHYVQANEIRQGAGASLGECRDFGLHPLPCRRQVRALAPRKQAHFQRSAAHHAIPAAFELAVLHGKPLHKRWCVVGTELATGSQPVLTMNCILGNASIKEGKRLRQRSEEMPRSTSSMRTTPVVCCAALSPRIPLSFAQR